MEGMLFSLCNGRSQFSRRGKMQHDDFFCVSSFHLASSSLPDETNHTVWEPQICPSANFVYNEKVNQQIPRLRICEMLGQVRFLFLQKCVIGNIFFLFNFFFTSLVSILLPFGNIPTKINRFEISIHSSLKQKKIPGAFVHSEKFFFFSFTLFWNV